MFLYAKLVLNIAKSAADLSVILDELETLPTGLDGAYVTKQPSSTIKAY